MRRIPSACALVGPGTALLVAGVGYLLTGGYWVVSSTPRALPAVADVEADAFAPSRT